MCGFVRDVLNTIKEPFQCTIDGVSQEFENGVSAIKKIDANLKVSHGIESIGTYNGKLCITIVDWQSDLDAENKVWIAGEKEKTGIEPSFF